jgi:hypothetical protein
MIIKPLYLLADSQLLFRRGDIGVSDSIRANLSSTDPKAAYIGASNDDKVEFYELFIAAMQGMGVSQCRMVPARPAAEDSAFLREAHLVVLAGGDTERGWRTFEQNGLKDVILRKRYEGSILVGISAGAVQLGLGALTQAEQPKMLNLFGFAPFYVGAHGEVDEWFDLRLIANVARPEARCIGIPMGGGAIYRPDGTLDPIYRPLLELVKTDNDMKEGLLLPLHRVAAH